MKRLHITPDIVITAPDKPKGRKLIITPPPVKIWALENKIKVFQPEKLNKDAISKLKKENYDLGIVAAYGGIIPKEILEIPKYGTLNFHPSLLPRLRGASPIQTAILKENKTGITIMLVDEEMDHGPIVAQKEIISWGDNPTKDKNEILNMNLPPKASELEKILSKKGGQMLAETIPDWINGKIKARAQNHQNATFTKKITKDDGLINLKDSPEKNFRARKKNWSASSPNNFCARSKKSQRNFRRN